MYYSANVNIIQTITLSVTWITFYCIYNVTNVKHYCYRAENNVQNDEDLLSLNTPVDAGSYQLIINKQIECNIDQVTNFVQQYVPECLLMANMEAQIMYNLPARYRNQFGPLYAALKFQEQNFKLNSIKITNSTTGDIYPR